MVTPSLNSVDFIEDTIKSVLDQNYPSLEYVIQDGGSRDGTTEIIQKYGDQLLRWESRSDKGQASAINEGYQETGGEIMAYLNADDVLLPGSLHYIARCFERYADIDVIYGHRILINEKNMEIGRWVLPPHCNYTILWHDFIPQETLFWRRSIWDKTGGYLDESFQFAMDWDLILRFRAVGARFKRLPRFLGAMRIHANMKSIRSINDIGNREMDRLRERWQDQRLSDESQEKYIKRYLFHHVVFDKLYLAGLLRY